jgi:drug/metabolite transporter (DMT)-like permease
MNLAIGVVGVFLAILGFGHDSPTLLAGFLLVLVALIGWSWKPRVYEDPRPGYIRFNPDAWTARDQAEFERYCDRRSHR